jgi:predicted alpha/beta hydrolase family esterase
MQWIILHGSFGKSSDNWFPWLSKKLIEDGHEVFSIDFPIEDWDALGEAGPGGTAIKKQNLYSWTEHFNTHIKPKLKSDQQLGVIAHSLAPNFVLHLLQDGNYSVKLGIFVAPFYEELPDIDWRVDAVNFPFRDKRYNWKHIKKSLEHSYVIHSDNDPYVAARFSEKFAKKISSSIIPVAEAGHFNTESGWTKAPLILELCRTTPAD